MKLPVRLVDELPTEAVIVVDGFASSARGLVLSHWPGNTTPRDLAHELSTGSALRFAALPRADRERRAAGCVAIVNNHYDTDGVLAMFAVRSPEAALERADALLAAARAGDFYQARDAEALALDTLVTRFAEPGASPLDLDGLSARECEQAALDHLVEALPWILDGGLDEFGYLFEDRVAAVEEDRELLEWGDRHEFEASDATAWLVGCPVGVDTFDPMRHALFGATERNTVVALGTGDGGTSCRLILSTKSWFDLPTVTPAPRPDLAAWAAELNDLEGTSPADESAWRAEPVSAASPELWFGGRNKFSFADRAGVLAPSSLRPSAILRILAG
ncbi:MAG: DUF6687 family protein [Planctomycetota bacterium]